MTQKFILITFESFLFHSIPQANFSTLSFGKKKATTSRIGKMETILMVGSMPIRSSKKPMTTAPIAPIPNAKPVVRPAIVPILLGTNSCAYTTVTEKLIMINVPIMIRKTNTNQIVI